MKITKRLNNGVEVLAKLYNGEPSAKTFANLTQARRAAEKVGGSVVRWDGPFYVRVGA